MKAKPPNTNKKTDETESKNEFIDSANNKNDRSKSLLKEETGNNYPWQKEGVREDILKTFNLRLSEPDYLKLKFISENIPGSMQGFCLDAIIPAIEKQIKNLTE